MNKNLVDPGSLVGKRVYVYRNLTKSCWSVMVDGIVRCHAQTVQLRNMKFVVRRSGYERYLRTNRKNVHAFVVGELVEVNGSGLNVPKSEVTYNPRVASLFYTVKKCFKGREYYFSPEDVLTYGYCSGKTVFVSNTECLQPQETTKDHHGLL